MKKRLLSALLALALVFVLLPTTALAGETTGKDYDISINGKGWKFEKDTPVYFYGYDPSNYFFSTTADHQWTTNSNLMLTKEGNTVTITIRPSKYHPYESPQFTLKKESTSTEKNDVPCIEMGNGNNLVITGKGTLNITRNESKSRGAALYSDVGDITINGGITVNISFLNGKDYNNKNVSSNAIYVGDNHNLTVSGSGTNVTATNQGFDSSPATVCVEGGTITVSGGASLSATNTYADNFSGSSVTQHFKSYAISGTESKPCTLIVADEKSSVTAWAYDEKYGKPFGFVTYNITGATVKAGSNAYYATETNIDNINGKEYVKISVPALETTADVLIAKENAVVGVRTSLGEGNGYYTYNKDTKTLTLEDVSITNVAHFIQFWAKDSYTIELKGTNTITGVTSAIRVPEKGYNNESLDGLNVTITGTGSLNVTANTYAIDMQVGNLIFNSTGNITLTTNTNYTVQKTVCNALHVAGSITIDNTKYDIVGARQEKNYPTETISDSSVFDPDYLNGYTVGGETTLFKTITITPAAAKDSTISYDGTTLKQGETITDRNGGTATVDSKNNTITLKNFNGTAALSFDATLADSTLVLEGTNTLSSIVTTQKGLTISDSGSLTVGSIRVTNNYNIHADLTITDGAKVTAGTTTSDAKAIDITGNLTVNSGATLTATNTSETKPTIDVTGNVTISGDPGTNAYTVSAHNSYNVQKDRDGSLSPSGVPSAIKIGGTLNISAGARVMAQTDSYGAGVMLSQNSTITVEDAFLSAKNSSCDFAAISFSGQTGDIYVSGKKGEVVAENIHTGTNLAFRAINAFVYNSNTDFYLKMQSEGVIEEAKNKIIAPGKHDASGGKKVTITRGDEVVHTPSPVVIAGTTLLNDTHYTINGSTVAEGTESNYNAVYDSKTKTLKLNNASINGTGVKAIEANVGGYTFTIELVGNNIIKTSGFANNVIDITGNLYFTGSGTAEISGKGTPIYATYKIDVSADVTITNTEKAGSFTFSAYGENSSNYKGANTFAIGTGYTAYATTDKTTWAVYDNTTASENESYTTLRITTQPPETGGGSTHQHVWDEAWHDTGDYHHAHQCTICKAYDTTTQEPHNVTGHRDNLDGSHSNICGSCGYSAKVSHSYTWAPNANDNEKHIGTCVCGNVVERYHNFVGDVCSDCGYDKSTGTTCEHVWTTEWTIDTVDNEYHWHKCIKCNAITDKKPHAYTIVTDSGTNHIRECECKVFYVEDHISSDWIIDTPATATTAGSMHKECTVCKHKMQTEVIPATGEIVPPTPDNPGTIVIIRPAEEEKPAQQPNPSTGANDLVGLAVAAAVAAALGSAALLRKHD